MRHVVLQREVLVEERVVDQIDAALLLASARRAAVTHHELAYRSAKRRVCIEKKLWRAPAAVMRSARTPVQRTAAEQAAKVLVVRVVELVRRRLDVVQQLHSGCESACGAMLPNSLALRRHLRRLGVQAPAELSVSPARRSSHLYCSLSQYSRFLRCW